MKIGINTLFLIPTEVGGTETYLCEILREFAETHKDIELVLFTNLENDELLRKHFGRFSQISFRLLNFRAKNRYARIIREQTELPFTARRAGVDLLWSPGYTAPYFSPCPQVVTIHDMQYKTHPEDLAPLALFVTDILVRIAVRRCRRIVTDSHFSKSEIMRHTGTRAEFIDVVHGAADEAFGRAVSAAERQEILRKLRIDAKPYILCVANTYPHKNVHALVEAFCHLQMEIPHNLVIVGKPRLGESSVQRALTDLKDGNRLIRIEYASRVDLVALYQCASLFVFPSMYEGFGLPVLEAMMSGVPVVTTRKASIPEVGGEVVCYFDPDKEADLLLKIRDMLKMDELQRRERIARAVEWAKPFTWSRTANLILTSFRQTLNNPA